MSAPKHITAVVGQTTEPFLRPEERKRALRALEMLLEGDETEQRETFAFLRQALDDDRPSYRKAFSDR